MFGPILFLCADSFSGLWLLKEVRRDPPQRLCLPCFLTACLPLLAQTALLSTWSVLVLRRRAHPPTAAAATVLLQVRFHSVFCCYMQLAAWVCESLVACLTHKQSLAAKGVDRELHELTVGKLESGGQTHDTLDPLDRLMSATSTSVRSVCTF